MSQSAVKWAQKWVAYVKVPRTDSAGHNTRTPLPLPQALARTAPPAPALSRSSEIIPQGTGSLAGSSAACGPPVVADTPLDHLCICVRAWPTTGAESLLN